MSLKKSTDPTPVLSIPGKAKKALVLMLAASGAVSLFSLPILVSASFLSAFLQHTANESAASATSFNSQTMPLLAAAKNSDLSAPQGGGDILLVHGEALRSAENPESNEDSFTKSTNAQISVYTVREGDSLSSIAAMFKVTTNTIIGANNIKKGVIHAGDELSILPIAGVQHKVLKGETLESLAKAFKSDASDIASYNDISQGDALITGQTIIIPNGEIAAPIGTTPTIPSVSDKPKTAVQKAKTTKAFKGAPLRDAGGPEYDGYYAWPVGGGIITQSLHGYNGVDIGAPTGTSIYASAPGTVIIAKNNGGWNGGYGNYIVVAHDNGTQTLYAHASKVLVSAGDSVTQGELIGKVGRTGEATGPHLHFEVRGATNPFGAIPVGSGE